MSAASGLQALALCEVEPFDLIVSDIQMPEMTGYELVRAIREKERERGSNMLAISVTGTRVGNEHERALSAGYDAHLAPPVEPERLLETIRSLRDLGQQPPLSAESSSSLAGGHGGSCQRVGMPSRSTSRARTVPLGFLTDPLPGR